MESGSRSGSGSPGGPSEGSKYRGFLPDPYDYGRRRLRLRALVGMISHPVYGLEPRVIGYRLVSVAWGGSPFEIGYIGFTFENDRSERIVIDSITNETEEIRNCSNLANDVINDKSVAARMFRVHGSNVVKMVMTQQPQWSALELPIEQSLFAGELVHWRRSPHPAAFCLRGAKTILSGTAAGLVAGELTEILRGLRVIGAMSPALDEYQRSLDAQSEAASWNEGAQAGRTDRAGPSSR